MTIPIEEILVKPEGKTLEFKRDLSSAKNVLETLVAFANSAGGVLVVGVDDKTRSVYGVSEPLDEEERLCSLIADGIEPRLVPNVQLIPCADRTLLAVEVYPSGSRPHWLKSEGIEGVYVRLGSTNRKADRAFADELRRNATGTGFDETPVDALDQDALDVDAANTAFQGLRKLDEQVETPGAVARARCANCWRHIALWKKQGNAFSRRVDPMRKV